MAVSKSERRDEVRVKRPKSTGTKRNLSHKTKGRTKRIIGAILDTLSTSNPNFKRNIAILFTLVTSCAGIQGARALYKAAENWQSFAIPRKITIYSGNQDAKNLVLELATSELNRTQRLKLTRDAFLKNLTTQLNNLKILDGFQMRAGLDRELRIKLTTQVPSYVATDSQGRAMLVGDRFRIMKEKISEEQYKHLLRLHFNQIISGKNAAFFTPSFVAANNLLKDLSSSNQKLILTDLSWDVVEGLSVAAERTMLTDVPKIKITFGFPPYSKKIIELREMLDDSDSKNMSIETVDFKYSGKAILKILDAKKGTKNLQ